MFTYLSFSNCIAKKCLIWVILRNTCVNLTWKLHCNTHPDHTFCVFFDLSFGFFCDNKNISWKVTFTLNCHLPLCSIFIDINFAFFRFLIASDIASYIIVLSSSDGPGMISFTSEKLLSLYIWFWRNTKSKIVFLKMSDFDCLVVCCMRGFDFNLGIWPPYNWHNVV